MEDYGVVTEAGTVRIERLLPAPIERVWAYTWGDEAGRYGEVTCELAPRGNDVLLVLTHRRLSDRAAMVEVAGGGHARLGILEDVLERREPRSFWSTHARVAAEYEKRFANA